MHHGFGVGLGLELVADGLQFAAELLEVLDDAVVHQGDPPVGVRVGVHLGRAPVRRPAGVADADGAVERVMLDHAGEVGELALGAAAVDRPVRSEEHTSELQSLMRISSAVFCLTKKIDRSNNTTYCKYV